MELMKAISQPDCRSHVSVQTHAKAAPVRAGVYQTHNGNANRSQPEWVSSNVADGESLRAAVAAVAHLHLLQIGRAGVVAAEAGHELQGRSSRCGEDRKIVVKRVTIKGEVGRRLRARALKGNSRSRANWYSVEQVELVGG